MSPAARISDMHACPLTSPSPHGGGPVTGPGAGTVLIAGLPAAMTGDTCSCVGPPDVILGGSTSVLIEGRPAARLGDTTAHGGSIVTGALTVLIN